MAKIVILHQDYGCDTGCCGHVIEVDGERRGGFQFSHPYTRVPEEIREWARELIEEEMGPGHAQDLDWENCVISDN